MTDALPWKVLLVDDEEDVLEVSRMVLEDLTFEDRPLNILTARSAREARALFEQHSDIALAFVDVVMETEHAGLDLVKYVREELRNDRTRLILRTGNPGAAPERDVVRYLEIDDYKEKTELTADRLATAVLTSLRSYRNLLARLHFQEGLQQIIEAPALAAGAGGWADHLDALVAQAGRIMSFALGQDRAHGLVLQHGTAGLRAVGGFGRFADGHAAEPARRLAQTICGECFAPGTAVQATRPTAGGLLLSHEAHPRESFHFWIADLGNVPADALKILRLFLGQRSGLLSSILLQQEVIDAQTEVLHRLCGAVESRSKETGAHIRRIAKYAAELGRLCGMDEAQTALLEAAAPLHDIGKVSIPDRILNKPGRLDGEEWELMKQHAQLGHALLWHPSLAVLRAGAEIARTHHERWDGSGYPRGLAGEQIPMSGRIVALVDVFDALLARRSYKEPWPMEAVVKELRSLRGSHFDPRLTDLLLNHSARFHEIFISHPD
jgi:response regulator RpfG family c-di-GMP phosphodiesterase